MHKISCILLVFSEGLHVHTHSLRHVFLDLRSPALGTLATPEFTLNNKMIQLAVDHSTNSIQMPSTVQQHYYKNALILKIEYVYTVHIYTIFSISDLYIFTVILPT